MDDFERIDPPLAAPEEEMLNAWLDFHRATLLKKVAGVSDEDLRRKVTPSGLTLLGLVKHLAYVERGWFQDTFAGHEVYFPYTQEDPDADWRIEPGETTADVLEFYRQEVRESRRIANAANLDDQAKNQTGQEIKGHTLRWILTHMIEETARHNGHADILREMIDGTTGS
ncbi:MAG: Mini-circle protein [Chloroflexi bacterium]|jgi:uncharacterized damage-inducible protein DinB|nr:Mini-circle protein [Chloroflexota bacterium]